MIWHKQPLRALISTVLLGVVFAITILSTGEAAAQERAPAPEKNLQERRAVAGPSLGRVKLELRKAEGVTRPMTDEGDRFPRVTLGEMNEQQRALVERINNGPRIRQSTLGPNDIAPGPFNAFMQAPALGALIEPIGDYVRFHSTFPTRLSELAIIITARHWRSQLEWWGHSQIAIEAGLKREIVDDIAANRPPASLADDEAAVYDFCTELLRDRQVSDQTFARTVALFGHRGAVELIGISGYYGTVSMMLNVAKVPAPGGVTPLPPQP